MKAKNPPTRPEATVKVSETPKKEKKDKIHFLGDKKIILFAQKRRKR